MPRLLSDDVQRVETFALDLRRNELDVEARPVIARAPPLRNLARRLGDDASRLFVRGRRRRLVATAEHQAKDGERRSATQRRSLRADEASLAAEMLHQQLVHAITCLLFGGKGFELASNPTLEMFDFPLSI